MKVNTYVLVENDLHVDLLHLYNGVGGIRARGVALCCSKFAPCLKCKRPYKVILLKRNVSNTTQNHLHINDRQGTEFCPKCGLTQLHN